MIVLLLSEIAHMDFQVCTTTEDNLHAWDPKDSRRLEARAFWMAITYAPRVRGRHSFGMTMRHSERITIFSWDITSWSFWERVSRWFGKLNSVRKRVRILLIAHSSFPQPEILDFWRFLDFEEDVISISSSFWRGTLLVMIVIITPWILGNLEFDLWSQVKGLTLMVTPIHASSQSW